MLEDKGVVYTVRLHAAGANLDIVRETRLQSVSVVKWERR